MQKRHILGMAACAAVLFGLAGARPGRAASVPALAEWSRFSVLTPAGPVEPSPSVLRRLSGLVFVAHKVQKGEYSAGDLAKNYGTTLASLQSTNGSELMLMAPGQTVTVLNKKGMLYTVRKETETLDAIVRRFRGESAKARELKEKVVLANDLPGTALVGPYELSRGETLLLPEVTVNFDTYRFPFKSPGWHRISSGFGMRYHPILHIKRFHAGLDLPMPFGTPVFPSRSGRVVFAGWMEGYGNMVEVRHSDGYSTRYGHLSKITITPGAFVVRGKTLLGKVGNTGLSTGPHLHFEVRTPSGHPINPRKKIGRL